MLVFLFFLLSGLFLVYYSIGVADGVVKSLPPVPILPGSRFFVGHLPLIFKEFDHLYDWWVAQCRLFERPFVFLMPGLGANIMLAGGRPENVKHVMKTNFQNYILPPVRL